jgi:hypothetical protein
MILYGVRRARVKRGNQIEIVTEGINLRSNTCSCVPKTIHVLSPPHVNCTYST